MYYLRTINTKKTLSRFLEGTEKEIPPFRAEYDSYVNAVIKLIPHEIVGGYLCMYAVIDSLYLDQVEKIIMEGLIFAACLILTPLYTKRIVHGLIKTQVWLSSISFILWALTIGSVLDLIYSHTKLIAAILLIIYSLIIPLIYFEKGNENNPK